MSTVGTAIGLTILGIYIQLKTSGYDVEPYNWIPIVSFSFVVFIAAWAVLNLPFVVIAEIMPENLKDFGASFCMTLIWICGFIVIKYLPFLNETFGFHGTMFLFAGHCMFSALFIVLFMIETRGKSYDQIMDMLK